jgi:hypothetical protein
VVLSAVVVAAVASGETAHETGRVGPVATLGSGTYPVVGLDARGDGDVVWSQVGEIGPIKAATWSESSDRWSRAVSLSSASEGALSPELAVDPDGAAVALWQEGGLSESLPIPPAFVEASFRGSTGGAWERPVRLSQRGKYLNGYSVGIDAHGDAVAVWSILSGKSRVEAATRSVRTGRWSAPVSLKASPRMVGAPSVTVGPSGAAILVWQRMLSGGPLSPQPLRYALYVAATARVGGGLLRPKRLGTEVFPPGSDDFLTGPLGPTVAINGRGDAIVGWEAARGNSLVPAVSMYRNRSWSRTTVLEREAGSAPAVGIDQLGGATIAWVGAHGIETATTSVNQPDAFKITVVPRTVDADTTQLVINPAGDATVLWSDGSTLNADTRSSASRHWCAARKIGSGGVDQLAIDDHGRAIAVWQHPNNHTHEIEITARSIAQCASQ